MKPLIVALDVETEKEALSIIRVTKKHVDIYKVGPALFLRYGPSVLKKISATGKKIFLDMKFHDIPNTMALSIEAIAGAKVFAATVHTSAGEPALRAVSSLRKRPNIWGVTVLTSLSAQDLNTIGFNRPTLEQTIHLAELAKRCGLDGIVASVGETAQLRQLLGADFTIVTPGIRLPDNEIGDQKRVATPGHARQAGSSFIVVGRPIIESRDPAKLTEDIMTDWKRGG